MEKKTYSFIYIYIIIYIIIYIYSSGSEPVAFSITMFDHLDLILPGSRESGHDGGRHQRGCTALTVWASPSAHHPGGREEFRQSPGTY